jgi:rhodanese-related sulfurtransferase
MTIGRYQLENLQRQAVPFLFLDLRASQARGGEARGHELLKGSVAVESQEVVAYVKALGVPPSHPIVIICEQGIKSMDAARVLEQNSFMNVFVVEGGFSSF